MLYNNGYYPLTILMTEIPHPPPPKERSLFITHHVPDMDNVSVAQFERIAPEIKKLGFSKHRFDIRWKTATPKPGEINESYLGKSALLAQAAQKHGLEPIIILSTPPAWAYKGKSPEAIRQAYTDYAKNVKRHFDRLKVPVKSIQILNELNNPVYTPKKLIREMPSLAAATREVFGETTDVTATVVLSKPWVNAEKFLKKYQTELSSLTSIGLDFYPGTYQHNRKMISPKGAATIAHQTLEAIATRGTHDVRRDFLTLLTDQLTDVRHFRSLLTTTKSLFPHMAIDIGEFGFPTLDPIQRTNPKHEALQSYAVDKITKAMAPVVNEFDIRNIGFYELFDDKEFGVLNWGIINDKGEAKHILTKLPAILQSLQATEPHQTISQIAP